MNNSEAGKLGALAAQETIKKLKLERIEKFNLDPTKCKFCNSPFSYEKRKNSFCNKSCSSKFNKPIKKCSCGKEVIKNKFCDDCILSNCHLHYIHDFDKLKSDGSRRKFLLRTCTHQCEICKITEWCGKPTPLIMDHIDGNPYNNIRTNVRLICPNCDAQLPTYKAKNKGNGRHSRKERYKQGKSF